MAFVLGYHFTSFTFVFISTEEKNAKISEQIFHKKEKRKAI